MLSIAFSVSLAQALLESFGYAVPKPAPIEMRAPEKLGPRIVPPPVKPGKK